MTNTKQESIFTAYLSAHPDKEKLCRILHKFSGVDNENVVFHVDTGKRMKVENDSEWNYTNVKMNEWFLNFTRASLNRPIILVHTCDNDEIFFELHEYWTNAENRFYPDLIKNIVIKEGKFDNTKYYHLTFTQDYGNGVSIDYNIRIDEEMSNASVK